jgi:phosphoribosyl-ATP pyrophosphohydrolase
MAKSVKIVKPKAKPVKAEKPKALKLPKAVKVKIAKPKILKPKLLKPKVAKPKVKALKLPKAKATPVSKNVAVRMDEPAVRPMPPLAIGASSAVLDRLWTVVMARRYADPATSHSARLLSRGTAKVAQKFGEEAVECLIEAVAGNSEALVAESADVLYHLLVLWVDAGIRPEDVWSELQQREGVSGIAEKSSRLQSIPAAVALRTRKIP